MLANQNRQRVFGAAAILLLLEIVCSQSARSKEQNPPSFRTTAQLVLVDTQVTEKNTGKIIDTLRRTDFEIYDNGAKQEIKEYSFETTPLDFAFLGHPGRGWANKEGVNRFRRIEQEAVDGMESQDRGAVIGHRSEFNVDVPLGASTELIRQEMFKMRTSKFLSFSPPNETRLYDALAVAATIFPQPRDRARRRILLAFTDGLESRSKISLPALITDLLEADITLNAAIFVPDLYPEDPPPPPVTVPNMPVPTMPRIHVPRRPQNGVGSSGSIDPVLQATGGESILMDKFNEQFPEFLRRIRLRYLLGFYAAPSSRREYHRLEVRLTPDAQSRFPLALIRARQGRGITSNPSKRGPEGRFSGRLLRVGRTWVTAILIYEYRVVRQSGRAQGSGSI